jgi:hypothetical protein
MSAPLWVHSVSAFLETRAGGGVSPSPDQSGGANWSWHIYITPVSALTYAKSTIAYVGNDTGGFSVGCGVWAFTTHAPNSQPENHPVGSASNRGFVSHILAHHVESVTFTWQLSCLGAGSTAALITNEIWS